MTLRDLLHLGGGEVPLAELSDAELGQRCSEVGSGIHRFAQERAHGRPRSMLRHLPDADHALLRSGQQAYDRKTRSLYDELFRQEVAALAAELERRGHLLPGDASALTAPGDLAAAAELGERLLELDRHLERSDNPA